ncbi:hypothetical protein NTE31_003576 [Vibrio cholerae]|nr:hypothetical protein [Vibrio cholerae]EJL6424465.1 hypothetical protein [Vibrio cholerae]EJL9435240.1 hypothetical protein [Vibrio cholerae]NOE64889.1 hypothetical protein [Vibrio cholerae]
MALDVCFCDAFV